MRRRLSLTESLRPFCAGLILFGLLGFLLFFKLGDLLPGFSLKEITTFESAQASNLTPRLMVENALYLPYKVVIYGLQRFDLLSLTSLRAISALCGFISVCAFYFIVRRWHTRRMALVGTVLYATSTGFLFASRVAGPEAVYLLIPLLLALGIKLDEGTQRISVAILSVVLFTGLLYLPGMVWLLVAAAIWQRWRIMAILREIHTAAVVFLSILAGVLMLPLVISLATNSGVWMEWLAYPLQNQTLGEFAQNLQATPWRVFVRHVPNPEFHVGRLALLDAITTAFILLGTYWYFFQRKLDRSKLIGAGVLFGYLLTAALGIPLQIVMLPFLYLLATGGATLMLQQWFTVFPRNPLARSVGLIIVIGMVGLTSFFHLRRYFQAWPNTPATKQVYSLSSATIER